MKESIWEFADIKNISPNLSTQDYLELMWLTFSDFEWKNVTSIWWWFWILEMDLAETWNTIVEMIDPIYWDKDIVSEKRKDTYERIKQKYSRQKGCSDTLNWIIDELKKSKQQKEKEIFDLLNEKHTNQTDCLKQYDYLEKQIQQITKDILDKENLKNIRQKYYENRKRLIQNLEKWKNTIPMTMIINPSYWEDIQWIELWTKDYVFINHVLNSFSHKIKKILEQADKILKNDWKIFITDYWNELQNLQEYFQNNWTLKRLWWTFCWYFKKWEYKKL